MYTNPITLRPQQDMPYDLRPRSLQWDEVMDSDSNCALSPPISSDLQYPAVHMTAPQELFLLSPQGTTYLGSNQDSPGELGCPDVNAPSNPNRRQSQNREAQRRFRERREQERIQLRKKMEEMRAENDALNRQLAEANNANLKLEVDNERLTKELETLRRRWQDVLRLMADMVQQEEVGEGASPVSCSSGTSSSSSRKDVQGLRSSIMMQMLVLLFDEKGEEGPHRTMMARLGALSGDTSSKATKSICPIAIETNKVVTLVTLTSRRKILPRSTVVLRGLLAMTPRGGKPQQILFVDGPSLGRGGDAKSRNTRSALIRRRISEKRSTYRQEEEAKREQLLAERQIRDGHLAAQGCTCPGTVRDQDLAQGSSEPQTTGIRTSVTVPQSQTQNSNNDGTLFRICETCGGVRVPDQTQSSTAGPSLSLVSSRIDPFSPVDATVGPSVDDILHHAFMNLWPNFRLDDYARRCYQSRLAPSWESNILIYTTLWAASCHRDVLRISYGSNPVLDTRDQLYYKGQLLRLLREHVADYTNEEWRDGVIMAILHLAVNETTRRDLSRDPSPFTPPFVDMQSLSFYGSRDYHSTHWNVIVHLLRQLGGIQSIKLFALGWLITIADLMKAAHALTKPLFPRVDVEGNGINLPSPLTVFPLPDDSSTTKKQGFRELLSSCPPVQGPIVDVFLHLSEYSTLVQWYYNRHLDPSDCDRFADVRNQVHHAIFSLPDEHDPVESVLDMCEVSPDDLSISHGLYLTCRLAANLYATHVTFPLPRSALIRAMILPLLASKLDQMTQVLCSPLLLWCATIAAIAAEEMPEQLRLVEHVGTLCRGLNVTSYPHFVGILETFAWVDVACSERCGRLWERLAVQSSEGSALFIQQTLGPYNNNALTM
ncbi:hypothetical protein CNMCM7691_001285 [Aspergillus felis]|uniref:BZIP domain-containing protein n=1 Tax=Aspergillus felis TaxID=1287682 RepID=A0A8H6R1F4_9EURO|nr:hypothetical protein CNMCM7691_001285 [Aspergillus felis]